MMNVNACGICVVDHAAEDRQQPVRERLPGYGEWQAGEEVSWYICEDIIRGSPVSCRVLIYDLRNNSPCRRIL